MPPSTRGRPRSSGGSVRSGPATIGRATARGDAASLLAAATADRPSSQPASEPARRTTVDALRKSQAAMLQVQGQAATSSDERASKIGSEGQRVPLPFAWFSKPAQAGDRKPSVVEGRRFAGWESKPSFQTAANGSPTSKVSASAPQREDTTYGSAFTDLSAHTEALKPSETIYQAKAEFDQWLASIGGDPRRTASAAALRQREGDTEHRKAYRAWSAQEMADAKGTSPFLEERNRAIEEVRRLSIAQARQRGEEARARQAAATAAAASTSAATSSIAAATHAPPKTASSGIAAATPAAPKAAWAAATAEDNAIAASSASQRRSTLTRPSSAPAAARTVSKSKPPSEVTSSRGSIPSIVPEIKAMLIEAALQERAVQDQEVSHPVHVCGSEAAASRCGSNIARSRPATADKAAERPATADKAAERTLNSSAGKRPKSASSIASQSTAAASDAGWPWNGKGNAGSRPQTADSVSSLGSSASAAGRPRTASSGISQAASAARSTASSRARSVASRRSEESLRKMLEKANGSKSLKGSKSTSSVGAGSASKSSVRGAAYMPRPASVASVATSKGTAC